MDSTANCFEFGHPRAQRRVFGLHRRHSRAKLLDAREQCLDQRFIKSNFSN
jgi:hypothetical protein